MFHASIVFLCCMLLVSSEQNITDSSGEIIEIEHTSETANDNEISSTVYQTLQKYHCSVQDLNVESELLLYGTKDWTFPVQDVNLTISYPKKTSLESSTANILSDYVITDVSAFIYIDGADSTGYIISGGLLKNRITVSFISKNISALSYRFWLYGVRKDTLTKINYDILC